MDSVVSFVESIDHPSKGVAVSGGILYLVSRDDNLLRETDPTSRDTTASMAVSIPGTEVWSCHDAPASPS